jgi:acetylornithine/succinyldiaminopimelate/putrescine aminotransferase
VICDLVNASDGSIFPPEYYRMLRICCSKARIFLLMDEAMTAIRCGAPWACQRPEYSEDPDLQPDMIAFGKGMGVSGVAVNFSGMMMRHLAYHKDEQILQTIRLWRAMVTRPIALPVLLEAMAIVNVAEAEDWPARSEKMGRALREFILRHAGGEGQGKEIVRGIGAFIAVDREFSKRFRVMATFRRTSRWARWLPKLDSPALTDPEEIERYLLGSDAKALRRAMASEAEEQGTTPLWCFICGIDASVADDWCRTCFLGYCGMPDCRTAFESHKCL